MIYKNNKLLLCHLILSSLIILSGLQLNAKEVSLTGDNNPNGNENELINLKSAATEEWLVIYDSHIYEDAWDLAIDSEKNSYLVGQVDLYNGTLIKHNSLGVYQWNDTKTGDFAYFSVCVDNSDSIFVAGSFYNATSWDTLLVKYDTDGKEIWNKTWGSPNDMDTARAVTVNNKGDIYIAGDTESYEAKGTDCFLIKYNSNGHKEWNRTWGLSQEMDIAYGLCIDSKENVFVNGYTNNTLALWANADVAITYWNGTNGDLLWNTTWGSMENEAPSQYRNMAINTQDCVYIVGYTEELSKSFENLDFFIVKYDNTGKCLWSKIWGSDYSDSGVSIGLDSDDNAYFVGSTIGYGAGLTDLYIAKFNSDGVQQWSTLWGRGDYDYPKSIIIDQSTNDIYIAGNSRSFSIEKYNDWFLLKNPSFPTSSQTVYNYIYNIVEEDDNDDDEEPESIPGYNISIFLCVIIGIVSVVIIKKCFKH